MIEFTPGHEIYPGLFLGPVQTIYDEIKWLSENDIKNVISVLDMPEVGLLYGNLNYCNAPLELLKFRKRSVNDSDGWNYTVNQLFYNMDDYGKDENGQFIFPDVLNECITYIDVCLKLQEKVYIHCYAGRNRSAIIVAVFISKIYKISLEHAINYVKFIRIEIDPIKELIDAAAKYINI